jgi:hypothetical protein
MLRITLNARHTDASALYVGDFLQRLLECTGYAHQFDTQELNIPTTRVELTVAVFQHASAQTIPQE